MDVVETTEEEVVVVEVCNVEEVVEVGNLVEEVVEEEAEELKGSNAPKEGCVGLAFPRKSVVTLTEVEVAARTAGLVDLGLYTIKLPAVLPGLAPELEVIVVAVS